MIDIMNYKYIIKITGPEDRFSNPLRKLKDEEFITRDEACDAIYAALYDIIDGELGCEFVDREKWIKPGMDDDEYLTALGDYTSACREEILRDGLAMHDGIIASVEEITNQED